MAIRMHDSIWRTLVVIAPVLGVGFLVVAAAQGEPEVAKSMPVEAVLAAVAALGAIVGWWATHQLRSAPSITVAEALSRGQPALVALSGRAQAMPGAAPFQSRDGRVCLWFEHTSRNHKLRLQASDSVMPFLLVDDSGQCVVLPAGAEVDGSTKTNPPSLRNRTDVTDITRQGVGFGPDWSLGERVLLAGDPIHVTGWFVPTSPESLELQRRNGELVVKTGMPLPIVRTDDPAEIERLRATPTQAPAPATAPTPMALPVMANPDGAAPFVIAIGSTEGSAGLYKLMSVFDTIVMCAAGGAWLWLARAAHG